MKKGVALILWLTGSVACWCQSERWTLAFWNVENFFDTKHDTLKEDFAFTPEGDHHWTKSRYEDKRDKIYKMIAAMRYPDVVGLSEVENDYVLRDLCRYTPLRRYHYEFVHYESPDRRGSDCALIYRKHRLKVLESRAICVSDSSKGFQTRDILLVGGVLMQGLRRDSCYILVNHWPSKLGGAVAERRRVVIAQKLRFLLDSLWVAHPSALVLAMGDFNSDPYESPMDNMGFSKDGRNAEGFINLMYGLKRGGGSYKYKDSWSYIDQVIANRDLKVEAFSPDFILLDDERNMGKKVFRTYVGMRYLGGFSDHLPLIIEVP